MERCYQISIFSSVKSVDLYGCLPAAVMVIGWVEECIFVSCQWLYGGARHRIWRTKDELGEGKIKISVMHVYIYIYVLVVYVYV